MKSVTGIGPPSRVRALEGRNGSAGAEAGGGSLQHASCAAAPDGVAAIRLTTAMASARKLPLGHAVATQVQPARASICADYFPDAISFVIATAFLRTGHYPAGVQLDRAGGVGTPLSPLGEGSARQGGDQGSAGATRRRACAVAERRPGAD